MSSILLYTLIFCAQLTSLGLTSAVGTWPLPRRVGYPPNNNPRYFCFKACVNFHITQKSRFATIVDECCEPNPNYQPHLSHEPGTSSQDGSVGTRETHQRQPVRNATK